MHILKLQHNKNPSSWQELLHAALELTVENISRILGSVLMAAVCGPYLEHGLIYVPKYMVLGLGLGIAVNCYLRFATVGAAAAGIAGAILLSVLLRCPGDVAIGVLVIGTGAALSGGLIGIAYGQAIKNRITKHEQAIQNGITKAVSFIERHIVWLVIPAWILCPLGLIGCMVLAEDGPEIVGECVGAGTMLALGAFLYRARRRKNETTAMYAVAGAVIALAVYALISSVLAGKPIYGEAQLLGAAASTVAMLPFVVRGREEKEH